MIRLAAALVAMLGGACADSYVRTDGGITDGAMIDDRAAMTDDARPRPPPRSEDAGPPPERDPDAGAPALPDARTEWPDAAVTAMEYEAFGTAYVATVCETLGACGSSEGGLEGAALLGSTEQCIERLGRVHRLFGASGAPPELPPAVRFDAEAGARCLDAIRTAGCDAITVPNFEYAGQTQGWAFTVDLAFCPDMFVGSLREGETCSDSLQCRDGFCDGLDERCPGTCRRAWAPGEECDGGDRACATSAPNRAAVCMHFPDGWWDLCHEIERGPTAPPGGRCGMLGDGTLRTLVACRPSEFCDGLVGVEPGTCRPRVGLGEDCFASRCAAGLICDSGSGRGRRCVEARPLSAGESCWRKPTICSPFERLACGPGAICAPMPGTGAEGDPCSYETLEFATCGEGLTCRYGRDHPPICAPLGRAGDWCQQGFHCASRSCNVDSDDWTCNPSCAL